MHDLNLGPAVLVSNSLLASQGTKKSEDCKTQRKFPPGEISLL